MHRRAWNREEAWATLETPERRASGLAEELWGRIRPAEGDTVADVGAGTGYFALPAARRVGPKGRVYAIDLSPELVELIEERARSEGLAHVVAVQNRLDRIPLPSALADIVLLANVLHDFPSSTIAEAVRLLRPGGRFVNVDWKKADTPGGPPVHVRFSPDEAARLLAGHGLVESERWELGPWHYALELRRASRT